MSRKIYWLSLLMIPHLVDGHPGGHSHGNSDQKHTYHESTQSALDPDPQPDLPPFCDLDKNGILSDEEIFGITEINGEMVLNPKTSASSQKMADECRKLRLKDAEENGGDGLFDGGPITPGKLKFKSGELALTIDDGPTPKITDKVLEVLAKYHVKATFFVVGNRIKANAKLVAKAIKAGHIIGNHTYAHTVTTDPTIITDQIIKGLGAFQAFVRSPEGNGVMVNEDGSPRFQNYLFRPPGLGWKSKEAIVLNSNRETRNLIGPIHANIGTDAPNADWSCWSKKRTPKQCGDAYYAQIMKTGRGIILSHDINMNTPLMLDYLLGRLHKEGGGIKSLDPKGVWSFVRIDNRQELENLETKERADFIRLLSDSH